MRNYNSDWNEFSPFGLGSNSVTKAKMDQVREQIKDLVHQASTQLDDITNVSNADYRAAVAKVAKINTRAQIVLEEIQSNAQARILIYKVGLKLRQLVANERLTGITQKVIMDAKQAPLTDEQKTAAIAEITNTLQFASENVTTSPDKTMIHGSIVSGMNAMNGAMAKYIADGQINAMNQINTKVHQIKGVINKKTDLSGDAQDLINHKLDLIKKTASEDIQTVTKFAELTDILNKALAQSDQVLSRNKNVLVGLTAFNQFVHQMKICVINLALSSDKKLQICQQIDYSHAQVLVELKAGTSDINRTESRLALIIIAAVSHLYRQQIMNQTGMLEDDQQQGLINAIKKTETTVSRTFKSKNAGTDTVYKDLRASLKRLASVMNQQKALIYEDQIQHAVRKVQLKIAQNEDLTAMDKRYLQNQVVVFVKKIQKRNLSAADLTVSLHKFFAQQNAYIQKTVVQRSAADLLSQIRHSHLSGPQKHLLSQHLFKIKNNHDLSYSNRWLFIKSLTDSSLKMDRSANVQRLEAVSHQAYDQIGSMGQYSLIAKLERQRREFSQQSMDIKQLAELDHCEQGYENRIYDTLLYLVYGMDSDRSHYLDVMIRLNRTSHHRLDVSILDSRLNKLFSDGLDQLTNENFVKMFALQDVDSMYTQAGKMAAAVKAYESQVLMDVKKAYVTQIHNVVQDLCCQLKAYSAKYGVDKIESAGSKAIMRINNAGELLRVESARQNGEYQMNSVISREVDAHSSTKAEVRQQIHHEASVMSQQLDADNDVSIHNRILSVINQADFGINRDLVEKIANERRKSNQSLGEILSGAYLRTWGKQVNHAQSLINKLVRVSDVMKQQAVTEIKLVDAKTVTKAKQSTSDELIETYRQGQQAVQKIVDKTVFSDPRRSHVKNALSELLQKVRWDVKQTSQGKQRAKLLAQMDSVDREITEQLSTCDDQNIQTIFHAYHRKLTAQRLNVIQTAELKRFNTFVKRSGKDLKQLGYLADEEISKIDAAVNRLYHKTIYDIQHAPDTDFTKHNERLGEHSINQIMIKGRKHNDHKKNICTAVNDMVKSAQRKVKDLTYLQPKDKDASLLLLKQTCDQVVQNIKAAHNNRQIIEAESKSQVVIKRVVNEVSSADVLLAAIKSANNRVSHSALSDDQKQATLRQIHEIINDGIKAQVKPAPSKDKSKPHKSVTKYTSDQIKKQEMTTQSSKQSPKSGHFFKRLFGKLGRAF